VRRQFADPELKTGERVERQVISYPGVYMRVVPELANCIVFMLAGKDMVRPSLSPTARPVRAKEPRARRRTPH